MSNEFSRTMKFLLVFFVVAIGVAVADINDIELTDEMIQELFDNGNVDELSLPPVSTRTQTL